MVSDISAVKYGKVLPRKEIGEETSLRVGRSDSTG